MKKYLIIIILFAVALPSVFAQDENTKAKDEPVSQPFDSGLLIDNQTTFIPEKKTLEFAIQHEFGTIHNDFGKSLSDLYGLYSSANVRLGLTYVIAKDLQIGAGLTKNYMYTDLNAKWTILEQTQHNTVPVAVSLFGDMAADGREQSVLGTTSYDLWNRLSYFSELIVSRKFNDWLSLEAGGSFTHYNKVKSIYDHDMFGAHINGKVKFSPQSSFIFTYDTPLKIKKISEHVNFDNANLHPNLTLGVEISTFTHTFQLFVGNSNGILPQHTIMWNQNKLDFKHLAFGFTITRLWMF